MTDVGKLERIAAAARGLVPPGPDEDPHQWRISVFFSLVIIGSVLAFHIAASGGWLSPMGISGVANASEVKQNGKISRAILRRLATPEIRSKVWQRCNAETAEDRERINRDLDRILEQFETDTGEAFGELPACSEV